MTESELLFQGAAIFAALFIGSFLGAYVGISAFFLSRERDGRTD